MDINLDQFISLCNIDYDSIEFFYQDTFCPSISYNYLVEHFDLSRCYVRYFNIDQFGFLYVVFDSYIYKYNDFYD